jgi:hypothetical protein
MKTDRAHISSTVGLIVLSCDRYSDLWNPFFKLFFSNWPDCPYRIYLAANQLKYDHPKVITLLSGPDRDWSSSIRKCVEQICHDYLFFFIDDAFLISKVDSKSVEGVISDAISQDINYLRLRPSPPPDAPYNSHYGVISRDAEYRASLFASVWKRDVFLHVLNDGETAWAFEVVGTERSRSLDGFFSTWREHFTYLHIIENGLYISKSVKALRKTHIDLDLSKRGLLKPWEITLLRRGALIGRSILCMLPRDKAERVKQTAYRVLPRLNKFKKQI